jgi:hypothetical protein
MPGFIPFFHAGTNFFHALAPQTDDMKAADSVKEKKADREKRKEEVCVHGHTHTSRGAHSSMHSFVMLLCTLPYKEAIFYTQMMAEHTAKRKNSCDAAVHMTLQLQGRIYFFCEQMTE